MAATCTNPAAGTEGVARRRRQEPRTTTEGPARPPKSFSFPNFFSGSQVSKKAISTAVQANLYEVDSYKGLIYTNLFRIRM
jgi:hypothetical protein